MDKPDLKCRKCGGYIPLPCEPELVWTKVFVLFTDKKIFFAQGVLKYATCGLTDEEEAKYNKVL